MTALSGMADSLDGIVARMYSRVTKTGDFLDHFADRLVDVAILAGLTFSKGAHSTIGFTVIILALLHSYLGTQMEATLGERSYKGTGKAELFVAFVAFSIARVFPGQAGLCNMAGSLRTVPARSVYGRSLWGHPDKPLQRFKRGLLACIERDGKVK